MDFCVSLTRVLSEEYCNNKPEGGSSRCILETRDSVFGIWSIWM